MMHILFDNVCLYIDFKQLPFLIFISFDKKKIMGKKLNSTVATRVLEMDTSNNDTLKPHLSDDLDDNDEVKDTYTKRIQTA